jgi:hypothetical protein
VAIGYRDGDQGPAQPLGLAQADTDGYFRLKAPYRPGREWQATCALPNGEVLQGPFIRSYRF